MSGRYAVVTIDAAGTVEERAEYPNIGPARRMWLAWARQREMRAVLVDTERGRVVVDSIDR